MKHLKTFENVNAPFEKYMLEWNGYDDLGEWNASNTLIAKKLPILNDYIDENGLTIKDNQYTIKGWRNNKWETLISGIK